MKNETIKQLDSQISSMLENKKNKCKHYISDKKLKESVEKALYDLENNHDTSWAVDIYLRNRNNLNKDAIFYRGNTMTYEELFIAAFNFAKSLKKMGYGKNSEIPVCVTNIPEFVIQLLAVSFIGAIINPVGDWFDDDYLTKILNESMSDYIFVSDDYYDSIKESIDKSNVKKIVMFSLENYLMKDKDGKKYNPFDEIDKKFHRFEDKTVLYKTESTKPILDIDEFLEIGEDYTGDIIEDCTLDDPFTITYTSGTTNPGKPKGCIHSNRVYLTLSRFKESDVSGMPEMKDLSILAHIPTYTHVELSAIISDTLYEKCRLDMEPFYDVDFFPYSIVINKPNFVPGGQAAWEKLCKLLNDDPKWKTIKMDYLMIPTLTGEACAPGLEKYINKTARKHKFGVAKLPYPLAPVTLSIGGGTGESSGIFVTLYKELQEKLQKLLLKNDTLGLTPHKFVDLEVLNENGDYCKIGEPGILAVNSACNMLGYTDKKLNETAYVVDKYGKEWLKISAISYKSDNKGRIKMKGRPSDIIISSDHKIYYYQVEDIISADTKNIMSCTMVKVGVNYICHIELQPDAINKNAKVLKSAARRLLNKLPYEILQMMFFRVRTYDEAFPFAPSGKRDSHALVAEGFSEKCIPVCDILNYNIEKKIDSKVLKKIL